jgi:hypothetical protein
VASVEGHLNFVQLLLEKGAYTDAKNEVSDLRALLVGYGCGNFTAALLSGVIDLSGSRMGMRLCTRHLWRDT